MYSVDNKPDRCPRGHQLGAGKVSLSWATEQREHVLYCWAGCEGRSRITLAEGGRWEVYTPGVGWSPAEG